MRLTKAYVDELTARVQRDRKRAELLQAKLKRADQALRAELQRRRVKP